MLVTILATLPILLLLLTAAGILIVRVVRPNFGASWLIATGGALASWIVLLVMRPRFPQVLPSLVWSPEELFGTSPVFTLDEISWPFALALASLCLGVLLTASARHQYNTHAGAWAGSLLMTATGLVAVQAANPLTLLISWTLIDILEMVILLASSSDRKLTDRAVVAFAARTVGTYTVYLAAVGNQDAWHNFQFSGAPPEAGILFLVGVGLRLGVLPLHLPYAQEPRLRRGLGTVLRLVPAAASLVALARLPVGLSMEGRGLGLFLALAALAAFYSSLRWVTAPDELTGRPYWMIALAALALVSVVRGSPSGAMAWGITLLLAGGCLFLYSARSLALLLLPSIGLFGLTGLPFSPSASGWGGLTTGPLGGYNLVFLAAHVMLLLGYVRHAVREGDSLEGMDRWVKIVYPLGLFILVFSHLLLGYGGWTGSWTPGIWPASLAAVVLAGVTGMLLLRIPGRGTRLFTPPGLGWIKPRADSLLHGLSSLLSLRWLYRLVWASYNAVGRLVGFITTILEGDGGVMWALVLLALLLSVLRVEGAP